MLMGTIRAIVELLNRMMLKGKLLSASSMHTFVFTKFRPLTFCDLLLICVHILIGVVESLIDDKYSAQ